MYASITAARKRGAFENIAKRIERGPTFPFRKGNAYTETHFKKVRSYLRNFYSFLRKRGTEPTIYRVLEL